MNDDDVDTVAHVNILSQDGFLDNDDWLIDWWMIMKIGAMFMIMMMLILLHMLTSYYRMGSWIMMIDWSTDNWRNVYDHDDVDTVAHVNILSQDGSLDNDDWLMDWWMIMIIGAMSMIMMMLILLHMLTSYYRMGSCPTERRLYTLVSLLFPPLARFDQIQKWQEQVFEWEVYQFS